MHQLTAATLDTVVAAIRSIQCAARANGATTRPRWPMIVLVTPKGWTGPKQVDGKKTEGHWRSHQVPFADLVANPGHLELLDWIALAFEPGEPDVLRRRPRSPEEPIFNRLMIERTLVAGVVVALVGVAAFWWMIRDGWSHDSARNALLLLMVLFENLHIDNCRSEFKSALAMSPLRSPFLLGGALGAFLVHLLALYLAPLQAVLRTEPVSLTTWAAVLLLALTVLVAMEIHKWTWRLRGRDA